MGITYIPNDVDISKAFANIGDLIGKVAFPNRQFQTALRNAFATNPELIQKFSDIEHTSPGTLARMGFGGATDIVGNVPESIGSVVNKGLRPGVQAALQNSEIVASAGERAVTGLTAGQQQQDQYELAGYRHAREFFQQNPKISIQDILDGKIDPQTAFSLSRSGAGQFLGFQLQNYMNTQDNQARAKLSKANDVSSLQDAVAKSKVNQAFSRYQAANAGSPAAWAQYLFGADVAELISPGKPPTAAELDAVKVADGRANAQERITQQFQSSRYLTDLDTKIRNYQGEETGRTFLVQQLNDVLAQMARYSGMPLTAEWRQPKHILGVSVPFTGNELVYRDAQGKEYTDPTVAIGSAITSAASTGSNQVPANNQIPQGNGQAPPDSIFSALYLKYAGNKVAINAELRRLGYAEVK